ncbi:MAG TPA: TrkA C-terminal domain-containing protein [Anaerolineae bacterium]
MSIVDVGQQTGLLVLAIRHDGQYHYKPQGNTRLHRSTETHSGDILIVVGTQAQLDKARGEGME